MSAKSKSEKNARSEQRRVEGKSYRDSVRGKVAKKAT